MQNLKLREIALWESGIS